MNKILVILLLCAASASCFELENLCSSDTFIYNDLEVNAFYRVQLNFTFKSLGHYLIDDSVKCDENEFRNKTNFLKAMKAKRS